MGEETTKVAGYGIIPKQVMKDTRLSIEAKAIYAYLSTYAGNNGLAFPSLELILSDLKIHKNRFYKHLTLLIDHGYINKSKENNLKGQYSKVIYKLLPLPQNEEVGKTKEYQGFEGNPLLQNEEMGENPLLQNEENPLPQNEEYKNNNINNNNNNNIYSPLPQNEEMGKKKTTKKDINKIKYAEFVSMSEQQYNALIKKYGEEKTKRMIEVLDNYKGAKGKKYKDDYRAILNWVVEKVEKEFEKKPKKEIAWEEVFNNVD
ncbi:hypothetical protein ABG79_02368 [Caloramator mitchellensis]|uniref:Helix-turn-helix domain protein n=1 Tax=Caloramator mitchellensis TaxID=908809 RepID=A0A0R3JXD9_CALMK|nr:helix-turn-helix domain-containing protein [Caloramator mitchellensis]KRQ85854.1 hypothetical protein ABG79_02368 [Caloramator mitchellensis]